MLTYVHIDMLMDGVQAGFLEVEVGNGRCGIGLLPFVIIPFYSQSRLQTEQLDMFVPNAAKW
jgi:hypothetical protein